MSMVTVASSSGRTAVSAVVLLLTSSAHMTNVAAAEMTGNSSWQLFSWPAVLAALAFLLTVASYFRNQSPPLELKSDAASKPNKKKQKSAVVQPKSSSSHHKHANPEDEGEMPHVSIIGGGLSGLSVALCLQRAGVPCTVYERDKALLERKQGYGLTLTNNPVGALAELNVLEKCIQQDCPSWSHFVLKPEGTILGYYGRRLHNSEKQIAAAEEADCDPNSVIDEKSIEPIDECRDTPASLRIPREDLRRMLYEQLAPDTVKWGYRLKDYQQDVNSKGKPLRLEFEDGEAVDCDVLLGADGIHSVVRKLRDAKEGDTSTPLRYLGVQVILGLSTATHPMLHEKGVYIVDGVHRLFTMPFRVPMKDDNGVMQPPLTMWQLSFAFPDEAEGLRMKQAPPEELRAFALKRTSGWIEPVEQMLRETPAVEIWSTPLYDRDPMRLRAKHQPSLVTLAGDAAHPMSMFKGQGANQALMDGPSFAQWIRHQHSKRRDTSASLAAGMSRDSLLTRIRQYESEIVSRSKPRVQDSREAAAWYHSPAACQVGPAYGLGNTGLRPGELSVVEVLNALAAKGFTAKLDQLEERVRKLVAWLIKSKSVEANNLKRRQVSKMVEPVAPII